MNYHCCEHERVTKSVQLFCLLTWIFERGVC